MTSRIREQIEREGFYSRNSPGLTDSDLVSIGMSLAGPGSNLFPGKVVEIRQIPGTPYQTLTRSAIPYHNDGLYRAFPPRFLMLYCVTPAARGGQTLLTRGDEAFGRLNDETRRSLPRRLFHFSMAGLRATRSMVQPHPTDGNPALFFVDPDIASNLEVTCADEEDSSLDTLMREIRTSLNAPRIASHSQDWKEHDLLIFDNYRVLHARTAYQGQRLLKRLEIGPLG